MSILYIGFLVLLAAILIWQASSTVSVQRLMEYLPKGKEGDKAGKDKWNLFGSLKGISGLFTFLAIYLLFLWMLWLFQDDVPLWKEWAGNRNLFLASQAAIIAVALTWKFGSGEKAFWVGVLLIAPLALFLVGKMPTTDHGEKSKAASRVTVIPVVAVFERWSEQVITPPSSWLRIEPEKCILVKNVRERVFELCPRQPTPLGDNNIANFAFRFKAKHQGEMVPTKVYHEPK
ncbi:MAG: hypothetical protein AAB355_02705 [Patescibacteria group bacterium]